MSTGYTTIRVTAPAADALRRVTLDVSARAGRRVTYSDALAAVVAVAARDLGAVAAALPDPDGTAPDQ